MYIKLGNKTVIVETKDDRAVFQIDCKPEQVIEFFDRNRNDTDWICSSDVNHPLEFNLPEDFDVELWLMDKLRSILPAQCLIDTETLKVIHNPKNGTYEITVRDNSKVVVNFQG